MDQLLPIIQRKRRPLQTAILPDKTPTVANCPHCGRSLTEPASVTLDPTLSAVSAEAVRGDGDSATTGNRSTMPRTSQRNVPTAAPVAPVPTKENS
jgi:hypothetical protein